jgi:hypothetical protein
MVCSFFNKAWNGAVILETDTTCQYQFVGPLAYFTNFGQEPLSIPPGQDSVPLRLLLPSWDCNQWRWDTLDATHRNHCPQAVLMRGDTHAYPENVLEVLLSHSLLNLDTRASPHASTHPIETRKLSPSLCLMRVYPKKTGEREGQARLVCWVALCRGS